MLIPVQKIVEFKDYSRLLSDFPVLFKADLIFKDISRKPSKFKYFSGLCEHGKRTLSAMPSYHLMKTVKIKINWLLIRIQIGFNPHETSILHCTTGLIENLKSINR